MRLRDSIPFVVVCRFRAPLRAMTDQLISLARTDLKRVAICQVFYFSASRITLIPTLRSLLKQPDKGIDGVLARSSRQYGYRHQRL